MELEKGLGKPELLRDVKDGKKDENTKWCQYWYDRAQRAVTPYEEILYSNRAVFKGKKTASQETQKMFQKETKSHTGFYSEMETLGEVKSYNVGNKDELVVSSSPNLKYIKSDWEESKPLKVENYLFVKSKILKEDIKTRVAFVYMMEDLGSWKFIPEYEETFEEELNILDQYMVPTPVEEMLDLKEAYGIGKGHLYKYYKSGSALRKAFETAEKVLKKHI